VAVVWQGLLEMEASDTPVAAVAAGVGGGSSGGSVDMMYEYAVNMVCAKCSEAVHTALDGMANVTSVTTNVQAQLVVVEGSFAPAVIVERLEKIGRKVKLIGSGCATAVEKGVFVVPAAVGRSGENSAGARRSRLRGAVPRIVPQRLLAPTCWLV
jgi:copper chaperone CopZ